ncbi:MAG: pyruvate kinase, partial [Candidatus Omnitrophica bacterium]|nr:pyruvate kinase [Candidatus Omnitrophota bacterium]
MNKTKIVCTIGPSSSSKNDIKKLIMSGMNIVRLNSAHNTLQWHTHIIKLIRALDKNIPIIFDLPGRKIRIKDLSNPYTVAEGKELIFTCDQNYAGSDKISLDYNNLHRDLKTGDVILADDGSLKFKVKKIIDSDIYCQIFTNGELKNRKGLNVPYIKINTPVVNKRDRNLIRFAIDNKVDWIGFSFAECAEHVKEIRNLLKNSNIGIISKIENKFGVEKIEEIIKESEGLLIDRGDLGAETSIEKIGILQKEIIKKASEYGKPVIIATEMLHSMIEKFYPTKAEVIDISNAILDG